MPGCPVGRRRRRSRWRRRWPSGSVPCCLRRRADRRAGCHVTGRAHASGRRSSAGRRSPDRPTSSTSPDHAPVHLGEQGAADRRHRGRPSRDGTPAGGAARASPRAGGGPPPSSSWAAIMWGHRPLLHEAAPPRRFPQLAHRLVEGRRPARRPRPACAVEADGHGAELVGRPDHDLGATVTGARGPPARGRPASAMASMASAQPGQGPVGQVLGRRPHLVGRCGGRSPGSTSPTRRSAARPRRRCPSAGRPGRTARAHVVDGHQVADPVQG